MARLRNMARMSVASAPGTGTITLGSAVTGWLSFANAGIQDGEVVTYFIVDGASREIGRGTYTASGTTLARTTILRSTNSNNAINATTSAQVAIGPSAEDFLREVNAQTGTTYTVLGSDLGKRVTFSNGSAVAVTLPQSTSAGLFSSGFYFEALNLGAGVVTITPTVSTINGASSIALKQYQSALIVSDGTNYSAIITAGTAAGLGLGATDSPQFAAIELGHPDTTIARTSAGVINVEGSNVILASNKLSALSATTSAELAGVISDETGSGALVFATSPTLVTPDLGTPTALTLTYATGLPVAGITASTSTPIGVGSIELGHASDTTIARTSAGVINVEGSNVILASNKLNALSATTSAELAGVISDETGTGALVFATSPTLVTPDLGTPTALTLTYATGLPVAGITASTSTAIGVGSIELGHASDTTIARASAGNITVEGKTIYRADGTDVALADGGTGASLTDPNADRIMFWDDSAGQTTWLEPAKGLSISGTTLIPAREVLSANRTYYVRGTDGSDSNNGLTNSSGGAFQTIQKAMDVVAADIDLGPYDVTIQVADGTYTGGLSLKSYRSTSGIVNVRGNTTTPANVTISITSGDCITNATGAGGYFDIRGFKLTTTTAGQCILIFGPRMDVFLQNIDFGSCADTHCRAERQCRVTIFNITVSGGAVIGFWATRQALLFMSSATITYQNSPAYTARNFNASEQGWIDAYGITFTNGNTVTGKRYEVDGLGGIFTASGGANYLPGNSAGTATNGGVYY